MPTLLNVLQRMQYMYTMHNSNAIIILRIGIAKIVRFKKKTKIFTHTKYLSHLYSGIPVMHLIKMQCTL